MNDKIEHLEVPVPGEGAHAKPDILAPDVAMLILTWATFFTLLAVLQKFAWKPILAALQNREDAIRTSLEQADKIKTAFDDIQQSKDDVLAKAHRSAQDIVEQSRKRAQDLARSIEERAKAHAQEIVEAAHLQVEGEKERAIAAVRRDSAQVAVGLAGKIMGENMDNEKNQKIAERYIKEI